MFMYVACFFCLTLPLRKNRLGLKCKAINISFAAQKSSAVALGFDHSGNMRAEPQGIRTQEIRTQEIRGRVSRPRRDSVKLRRGNCGVKKFLGPPWGCIPWG